MKDKNQRQNMMMGIPLGLIFGSALGASRGNMGLWIGLGLILGTTLGSFADYWSEKNK